MRRLSKSGSGGLRILPRASLSPQLMVIILASAVLQAADVSAGADPPNVLVNRFEEAAERGDWSASNRIQRDLIRLGPEVIPVLLQRIRQDDISRSARLHLLDTLRRVRGEETMETLLDLTLNHPDPEFALDAGAAIPHHVVLKRRFTEAELKELIGRLSDESRKVAKHWSSLLARAEHVDDERIAGPIIELFGAEMKRLALEEGQLVTYGSDLSGDAMVMNGFLLRFPHLDPTITVPLLRDAIAMAGSDWEKKWWLMALGMSGDRTVGDKLREIVESTDEDVSVRACALRAYARALGEEAVPLLKQYEEDTTPGPNPRFPPLRGVARDTQVEIRRGK